jgi:predicted membrane channel-forming protein YqfA (hemolysin III family)
LILIQKNFDKFAIDIYIALGLFMLAYFPENKEGDKVNGNYVVAVSVL